MARCFHWDVEKIHLASHNTKDIDPYHAKTSDSTADLFVVKDKDLLEDPNTFFVVEALLDRRDTKPQHVEYLVRWMGYGPEEDSWEPRDQLMIACNDLVQAYDGLRSEDEELHCICRRPYKFEEGGMIQCWWCENWYHFKCLDLSIEQVNQYLAYACFTCTAKNPTARCLYKRMDLESTNPSFCDTKVRSEGSISSYDVDDIDSPVDESNYD